MTADGACFVANIAVEGVLQLLQLFQGTANGGGGNGQERLAPTIGPQWAGHVEDDLRLTHGAEFSIVPEGAVPPLPVCKNTWSTGLSWFWNDEERLVPRQGSEHTGGAEARFERALQGLAEQLREDRSVLAVILCGSLSHDVVWEKSDIDLAIVTQDDKPRHGSLSLNADGVVVHAFLMTRTQFRQTVEGAIRNSFTHSLLAKGRLVYSHDETIVALCAGLAEIGQRDTRRQLMGAAIGALLPLDKARKWLVTRNDADYAALWLLYAVKALARMEVLRAGQLADREVIPQAQRLNPEFFGQVYKAMLNSKKTATAVRAAIDAADGYVAERAAAIFRPILEYLEEVGEARSCSEIDEHFQRQMGVDCASTACEYLARRGLIAQVSTPVQVTKRSNVSLDELAFIHLGRVGE